MYDVGHDNTVSKQELTTLLNHVPKEAFMNENSVYTPPVVPLTRQQSAGNHLFEQLNVLRDPFFN
jgi:hypothetical protein